MEAPRVTVLITPRDESAAAVQAIEAVRGQTHSAFRLLVADDGSADGTDGALRARFAEDPRLRIEAWPRRGTAATRNAAMATIGTDWTAYLDTRDGWASSYLEAQLAALDADPGADLVVAGCRYRGESAGLYATTFDRPDWRTPDSLVNLCAGAFAYPSAIVVRTAVARAIPLDASLEAAADLDWLFRLVAAGHHVIENRATLVDYGPRPGLDPELMALEADEVRNGHAGACGACRRDPLDLVRRRARYLARVGRRREARAWFWRWWKKKPDSTQALGGLLRCLLARK